LRVLPRLVSRSTARFSPAWKIFASAKIFALPGHLLWAIVPAQIFEMLLKSSLGTRKNYKDTKEDALRLVRQLTFREE